MCKTLKRPNIAQEKGMKRITDIRICPMKEERYLGVEPSPLMLKKIAKMRRKQNTSQMKREKKLVDSSTNGRMFSSSRLATFDASLGFFHVFCCDILCIFGHIWFELRYIRTVTNRHTNTDQCL